jgi:hypothetical protein
MPMSLSASDMTRIKRLETSSSVTNETTLLATVDSDTVLNNTQSTIFAISCIDPRFTFAVEEYLLDQLGPSTSYDLFVLAGSALGGRLVDNTLPTTGPSPGCSIVDSNESWRETLLDHIQVAISLHNVTQIYIIDHLGCAAFTSCGTADTVAVHFSQFNSLRTIINGASFFANGTVAPTSNVLGSTIFSFKGLYFDTPVGLTTQLFDYTSGAPGTSVATYTFPSSSGAKVLVLGCIDPRFSQILSSFLNNYKGVQFIYDLFITAGSSLGVNQSYDNNGTQRADNTTGAYPNNLLAVTGTGRIGKLGHNWGPTFFDHLKIALEIHNITEVWVFDHLDCGAYKAIKFGNFGATDLDPQQHIPELAKLQGFIKQRYSQLRFKGFIMDTAGRITKAVDDELGIEFYKSYFSSLGTFGSSKIRAPVSEIIELRAKASADYVLAREYTGAASGDGFVYTRVPTSGYDTALVVTGNAIRTGFGRQLFRTKLTPTKPGGSVPTVLDPKVILRN